MQYIYIKPNEEFIPIVAEFLAKQKNIYNYVVIAPSGKVAYILKRYLMNNSAVLMPEITTINNLYFPNLPQKANFTHQIFFITRHITGYLKKNYSIVEALKIAKETVTLFNSTTNLDLDKIIKTEAAEHIEEINAFLPFLKRLWEDYLKETNKVSIANYRKLAMQELAKNNKKNIILADVSKEEIEHHCIEELIKKAERIFIYSNDINNDKNIKRYQTSDIFSQTSLLLSLIFSKQDENIVITSKNHIGIKALSNLLNHHGIKHINTIGKSLGESPYLRGFFKIAESIATNEDKENYHCFYELLNMNIKLYMQSQLFSKSASEFFQEILEHAKVIGKIMKSQYLEILQHLIFTAKEYTNMEYDPNIIITSVEDSIFFPEKNKFLLDFSDRQWTEPNKYNIWCSESTKEELGIYSYAMQKRKFAFSTRILLSSSNNIVAIKSIEDSFYDNNNENITTYITKYENKSLNEIAQADLPDKISATNIELLIRNPYGFYAKNILKLRKIEDDEMSMSKFGIFIHRVFAEYAELQAYGYENLLKLLEYIASDIGINRYWLNRFLSLAEEYIEFEDKRRDIKKYAEIKGEMQIEGVKVFAIADRIEISSSGKIDIIDFKTGAVPTRAEIDSGISSQMLIEAMIAANNGYKDITTSIPDNLCYIKVASTKPYLRMMNIPITSEMLKMHLQGLRELICFFQRHKSYAIYPHIRYIPKYDDYKHLARIKRV